MRVGVGVSTGSDVVCAAVVVTEDDGSTTVEYRTVSADSEANTDVGDLVASAIELMMSLVPVRTRQGAHSTERREPDGIAVSYRTAAQAASIRNAIGHSHRDVSLVPESSAAHAFLADSGLIARYRAVSIVDVGASGTTASIIDAQSGAVLASERTEHFGGDVIDGLVKDVVYGLAVGNNRVRDDLRDDRGIGSARYRTVKEHLSTHDEAHVDHTDGPVTIDRARFDTAVRPYATSAAHMVTRVGHDLEPSPEAIVLIGGGAYIPLVRKEFEAVSGVPVIAPSEPDTILAKGAAHLALSAPRGVFPTVGPDSTSTGRSVGRYSGILAGALLIGGLVLAYGVQALGPAGDSDYAPAGTEATAERQTAENRPIVDENPTQPAGATTTVRTATPTGSSLSPDTGGGAPSTVQTPTRSVVESTPTLHPAPDLPVIPWPVEPSSPDSAPVELPAPIVTTTPAPPATEEPDRSPTLPPTTTPEIPSETPGVPTTTPPPPTSAPTTDVNGTPTSPVLTPPPTVWSPPASVPGSGSVGETPSEQVTVPAPAPTALEGSATTPPS